MWIMLINNSWMLWNLFLAFIGVLLSWGIVKSKTSKVKVSLSILWLIFVPNTVYILTDVLHLHYQWFFVSGFEKLLLVFQYILFLSLGVLSYIFSLKMFEAEVWKALSSVGFRGLFQRLRRQYWMVLLVLNYAISFGVVMGRYLRTNSWYVLTNPGRVLSDALAVAGSFELMLFVSWFWVILNIVYFSSGTLLSKKS